MVKEIGPAKLRYAIDKREESVVAIPPKEPATLDGSLKPAALRYAREEVITPTRSTDNSTNKEKPPATPALKAPEVSYRIPRQRGRKKGRDLMGQKKVVLKVEDLQRAGRSHFEILKSQQKASVNKTHPRRG